MNDTEEEEDDDDEEDSSVQIYDMTYINEGHFPTDTYPKINTEIKPDCLEQAAAGKDLKDDLLA
jgi:hypothetical protein